MNFYNGFSPRERRAWNGRALPIPLQCSICGCGPEERPLAYHGEDYRSMDSVYAICRRCHYAIHIRFRRPDHWRKVVRCHEYPGAWFTLLSTDPASLWRPFDETYPQGLPGPDGIVPREPRLPLLEAAGENPPNELMTDHGHIERMDAGTAREGIGADAARQAVGAVHGAAHPRGQGGIVT